MKYNFAVVSTSLDVIAAIINIAQEISLGTSLNTDYLAKDQENLNIPYISLVQFELEIDENNNLLNEIWQQAAIIWQNTVENYEVREDV